MAIHKTLVLILLLQLLSFTAFAEYRAFELLITNTENGDTRTLTSTLDHLQYSYYYPIKPTEYIQYVTSWRCPGRTNERPICPNLNLSLNTQP